MIATTLCIALAPSSAPARAPAPAVDPRWEQDEASSPPADADVQADAPSPTIDPQVDTGSPAESSSGTPEAPEDASVSQPPPPEDTGPPPAGAIGGKGYSPLPPPPGAEDPGRLETGPWRGRGWFDVRLGVVVPLGGARPAAGEVVSAGGGFDVGWRIRDFIGLYAGVSTHVHDREVRSSLDEVGDATTVAGFGRMVLFDLAVARLWLPVGRRVQPWADVGAGVGIYRAPFSDRGKAVGHVRGGLGMDVWIGKSFTLGLGATYRLLVVGDALGHALQAGPDLAVHW